MTYSRSELRTKYFYNWEILGRGWHIWPEPVDLEPPFYCFNPQEIFTSTQRIDDGKKPSIFDSLSNTLSHSFKSPKKTEKRYGEHSAFISRGYYRANIPESITEIVLKNPGNDTYNYEAFKQFILIATDNTFLSYEIMADANKIEFSIACDSRYKSRIINQLKAYFPTIRIETNEGLLQSKWLSNNSTAIMDFGLKEEFMRPLKFHDNKAVDPLIGLIAAMENISDAELGVVQFIIQPVRNAWSREIMDSVSDGSGNSFFVDSPDMVAYAKEKVFSPLYAVIIRIVVQCQNENRCIEISDQLTTGIIHTTRSPANSLKPLSNKGYSYEDHAYNVFYRASNRAGMILNLDEIINLVRLPSPTIVSSKIQKEFTKSKLAPYELSNQEYVLGINYHQNESIEIGISEQQRLRHIHVIGATGTGKSTFLLNLISQDLHSGRGLAVLDPHGDLIEDVIKRIPEERIEDVVIIDPSDLEYPVGVNILSAKSEFEKIVLSSDIVYLFKRLSTSWGDQMHSVLANAIMAFLESNTGGTLIDLKRFLIEPGFRNKFLETVESNSVKYYWKKEFPLLRKNAFSPILTRLDSFLRPSVIRNMLAQKEGLDFNELIRERSIVLIKLSHGLIGKDNSYLLGSLLVAKLHQTIQARQSDGQKARISFYLYIDEFHNFVTPSMEEILSGARKYGLGLILAHQNLSQLHKQGSEIEEAVISNAGTRICFELGDSDARKLEKGFTFFQSEDFLNLGVGQAIVRVGKSDNDFNIDIPLPLDIGNELGSKVRGKIYEVSRSKYSTKKSDIPEYYGEFETRTNLDKPHQTIEKDQGQEAKSSDSILSPNTTEESSRESLETSRGSYELGEYLEARDEKRKHIYYQALIKRTAESQGFLSIIEAPTPDGNGRVDVEIKNDSIKIACEISITTTPQHELGNIRKCQKAGYDQIIVCSSDKKHLNNIRNFARDNIEQEDFEKLLFLEPETLIDFINNLGKENTPEEKRYKGRKVKTSYSKTTELQRKRRQEAIKKILLDSERKRQK